jgi:hypothetical protein
MVGAITNGLSNPIEIPKLSEFFDFCVSAEEDRGPTYGILWPFGAG